MMLGGQGRYKVTEVVISRDRALVARIEDRQVGTRPGVPGVPGVRGVPGVCDVPGVRGVPGISDVPAPVGGRA